MTCHIFVLCYIHTKHNTWVKSRWTPLSIHVKFAARYKKCNHILDASVGVTGGPTVKGFKPQCYMGSPSTAGAVYE